MTSAESPGSLDSPSLAAQNILLRKRRMKRQSKEKFIWKQKKNVSHNELFSIIIEYRIRIWMKSNYNILDLYHFKSVIINDCNCINILLMIQFRFLGVLKCVYSVVIHYMDEWCRDVRDFLPLVFFFFLFVFQGWNVNLLFVL